jgi:hypothetical protein
MEMEAIAGMVFTLLFTALVGGFILLFPVSRRLGLFLESKLQERKKLEGESLPETIQLREQLQALEAEVRQLADRQQFTEKMLAERRGRTLPSSSDSSG